MNGQPNIAQEILEGRPFFLTVADGDVTPQLNAGDRAQTEPLDGYEGAALYALHIDGELAIRRVTRQAGGIMLVSHDSDGAPIQKMAWAEFEDAVVGRVVAVVRELYFGGLN
ncbi:MAG: hypothetical protein GC208_09765 [Alphaproteobacteria bacterium]|nr:hypothetical protein [Alphaproteobacteria bacterium]